MKKLSAISDQLSAWIGHPERSGKGAEPKDPYRMTSVSRGVNKLWAVAFLAAVLLLTVGAGDNASRFTTLGHHMMCTCGCNQVLLECNHVGCTASDGMRAELKASLDLGHTDDQVLDGFVQKYGATVLNAPTTRGFNLVAWIMPFAVLGLATWVVIMFVRKWQARPAEIVARAGAYTEVDEDALRRQAREETEV